MSDYITGYVRIQGDGKIQSDWTGLDRFIVHPTEDDAQYRCVRVEKVTVLFDGGKLGDKKDRQRA